MEERYFCIGNYWKIHIITAGSAPTLQKMDGHMYSGYLGWEHFWLPIGQHTSFNLTVVGCVRHHVTGINYDEL